MYTLPTASAKSAKKWEGDSVEGFPDFEIVWCGEDSTKVLRKNTIAPKNVFILSRDGMYKWLYIDANGASEIPHAWYTHCFNKMHVKPTHNGATVKINGTGVHLPLYPNPYYSKLFPVKKRKRAVKIQSGILFPTWEHSKHVTGVIDVACQFKELFSSADLGEITLPDPFNGYSSVSAILENKAGKQAYMAIAGFVYHHCRDNLGYPINL
jgi:hypothetical protein